MRPQQLIVIKGAYQIGCESRLGISVIAGCYLSKPEHFVSEAQMWDAWKSAPLSFPVLDAAEPKPFAEYLLAGHAGIGRAVESLNVSVKVGGVSRYWRVEGDRDVGSSALKSTVTFPLDHPSAWGGKEVKENPMGRGGESDECQPSLMILNQDNSVQERSPLAAPTPLPHEFHSRKMHLDAISSQMSSEKYLHTIFPGLPAGIDRRFFQMAAPAQWLTHAEWPDLIPFSLQGFRPEYRSIEGVLPQVRGRAFTRRHCCCELEEIVLERKTLWFFPDSNIALMIFTGSVPIEHLLDESIESLIVSLDRCDAPRTTEHFQQVHQKRSDNGASPFEFMFDRDLMPEDMGLNITESARNHPDSSRYDPGPTSKEVGEIYYQRIRSAINQHASLQQSQELDLSMLTDAPNNIEEALLFSDASVVVDKSFTKLSFSAALKGTTFTRCGFKQCDFSHAMFEECVFENCVVESVDFSHASLNKTKFSDCSLMRTVLTDIYLTDVVFEKVNFEVVCGDRLRSGNSMWNYCIFNKCSLTHSRFDDCTIRHGIFNETDLVGAQFQNGQLDASVFNRCCANGVTCIGVAVTKNSLLGGSWRNTRFNTCRLESMTAGMQVDMAQSSFNDCDLNCTGFKQALMQGCQLLRCSFTESNFDQADLTASFISACDMAGARFKDSILVHSRWFATSLQQGVLYNADLRSAKFERCNLAAANMAMSMQNTETQFSECLLDRACWLPRRGQQGTNTHG